MFHLYFGESIPSATDWIQAICAILVLLVTVGLYRVAKEALSSWRDQDRHTLILELIKNAASTKRLVSHIRNPREKSLSEPEQHAISDKLRYTASDEINRMDQLRKITENKDKIEQIEQWANISVANLETDNVLRIFYVKMFDILNKLQIRNNLLKHDLDYKEKMEEKLANAELSSRVFPNFAIGGAPSLFPTSGNVLKEKLKKELLNVNESSEEMKKHLFSTPFGHNDDTAKEIGEIYDKVKVYINFYSNPKIKR